MQLSSIITCNIVIWAFKDVCCFVYTCSEVLRAIVHHTILIECVFNVFLLRMLSEQHSNAYYIGLMHLQLCSIITCNIDIWVFKDVCCYKCFEVFMQTIENIEKQVCQLLWSTHLQMWHDQGERVECSRCWQRKRTVLLFYIVFSTDKLLICNQTSKWSIF